MPAESLTRERAQPSPSSGERLPGVEPAPTTVRPNPAARLFDLLLAALLLPASLPLLLVGMLLVRLSSPGPVFYAQTRLGRRGKPFQIYKIRTMHKDCERVSGPAWSLQGDPRVFPVGRFLRRTHIDELPQLWNILRGDMSLIGPRPERPEFVPQLERVIAGYRRRLRVLPGLTGLAQVSLPPDSDLDSVRRKVAYDLYYIGRRGVWLDVRILAATFCKLVLPGGVPCRFLGFPAQTTVDDAYLKLIASVPTCR